MRKIAVSTIALILVLVSLVSVQPTHLATASPSPENSLEWVLSSAADWDSGTHDNTASWQEKLRLEWPLVRENYRHNHGWTDGASGVSWSPHDPKLMAYVCYPTEMNLIGVFSYDNATTALAVRKYQHDVIGGPYAVSWSPHDPKLVAAVGSDSDTIAVFSYDNVANTLVIENSLADTTAIEGPHAVSWSPHDPKLIAVTGSTSDTIAVFSYDNTTGALVRENYLADSSAADYSCGISWSPHDPKLMAVTGVMDDTIAVFSYDNTTKALVRENYLADATAIDGPRGVSWSPHDPKLVAAVGYFSDAIAVFSYDNTTKALVRENYLADTTAIKIPYGVSWSPHDPKLIAVTGSTSDTIAVFSYDNSTGALVRENYLHDVTALEGPRSSHSVSWSPHDPKLMAATGSTSDTVAVFSGGFKSNGEWTSPWDNLGTTAPKVWLELKLQTSVPSGCDENITVEVGSGGAPSDSKTFNYAENTGFDGENRIYDISSLQIIREVRIMFEFSSGSSPEVDALAITADPVLTPPWIDSIAVDQRVVDREMDYAGSGATLQTRIYVVAKDNFGRFYLDNVYFWIRDGLDAVVVDNEMHQGYENIDENTKRFWYDYDPDAMADNALGKFDVKAQVVATDSTENTKDFTDLGFELFTVNDLSLPSPTVDDPTPYRGQTIRVSGSVSRVYGTASLDSAWVVDQIEGVLVATVVGNTYTKEYLVTSETGTKVNVHVRAFDAGSGLDGISPSVSYTVVPIPIPWVMLVLGAYENEEEPGVAPELQSGTYIGSEWVPRDWFYLGETCFLRALVRDAETRDPIALATVTMKLEYEGRKFTVLNPELGLYEGHLLLENIPIDYHMVDVDVYAKGYARWDGAAKFTVAPAPLAPPPPVEEKPALPAPEPIDLEYWPLLPVFALALALVWPKARWDRTPRNWDSRSPPGSWTFIHEPWINVVLLALCGLMLAFVYFVSGLTSFVLFYGAMVAAVALIVALELTNPSAPPAFVGLGFPGERPRLALAGIFLGALIFLAAGIAVKVFGITFEAVPRVTVPFFSAELIPNLLMTGTLVPIIEEKFFRGVFTSFLAERTGILLAVGLGGVTFGAAHWVFGGGVPLALFATFFGGVVGWLMLRQQSLLLGIATHMTYNTLIVLMWMGYLEALGGMLPW